MGDMDRMVSAGAWHELVERYKSAGGADASDEALAEILRQQMIEVEGE